MILEWLKSIFKNPKALIKIAVDSLDLLVPEMARRIETIKQTFNAMDSTEKSQWVIDEVQAFLRKQFKLDA